MYYILNKNIALRSWWRVPYAYYRKGVRDAQRLEKEEFELLSLFDRHTYVTEGDLSENELMSVSGDCCNHSSEEEDDNYEGKNQWFIFTKI